MKVCIISGYPPLKGSGAESTSNFVQALSEVKEVSNITVLANHAPGLPIEQSNGVTVLRIWKYNSLRFILEVPRYAVKRRPDVIHLVYGYLFYGTPVFSAFFLVSSLFMFKFFKKRVVVTMHNVFSARSITKDLLKGFSLHGLPFAFKLGSLALNKTISLFADKIIVLCKEHMKILQEEYRIKNVIFIPIFIPSIWSEVSRSKLIAQTKAKQLLSFDREKNIILSFGFIAPHKGLEYAIQALPKIIEKHPDTLLIIAGSLLPRLSQSKRGRMYVDKLRLLVSDLSLERHVIFTGYIPEVKVPLYFRASDIVVLPYIANPGPSEILRIAAVYGKPVVASNVDYFSHDITNGANGLLVPPKNSEALAQVITTLLKDSELSEKISIGIHKMARDHSFENVVKKVVKLCYLGERP